MRILAILIVSAFILSVTPVAVLAGGAGTGCIYEYSYQPQLVKTSPAKDTNKEKSEVLVAKGDSSKTTKGEKR